MQKNTLQEIYDNLRGKFIIIGLTGAVGSGCTISAEILSQKSLSFPLCSQLPRMEYRRALRLHNFYKKNQWRPFFKITVSDILLCLFAWAAHRQNTNEKNQGGKNILINFAQSILTTENQEKNEKDLKEIFNNLNDSDINILSCFLEKIRNYYQRNTEKTDQEQSSKSPEQKILDELKKIEKISKKLTRNYSYIQLFQIVGKYIRMHGKIGEKGNVNELIPQEPLPPVFLLPELIRRIIKVIWKGKKKKPFFVIDALRNSYEIEFFRARYNAFYLFSILASEAVRKTRMINLGLTEKEFEKIKKEETQTAKARSLKDKSEKKSEPESIEDIFASQKIMNCISRGDVFINNDDNSEEAKIRLKYQLMKYVALILRPGLVTPTEEERSMQLAFSARYSSGCLSRQVGAVVVGKEGYIRGMGWNDPPEGFIPCLYRTPNELITCTDKDLFSDYERSKILEYIKNIKKQNEQSILFDEPFCFKDYQREIEFEEILRETKNKNPFSDDSKFMELLKRYYKNPSRERALHAEENAFLQITKVGGQPIVEATLYTTAFPCQLCAKKSMQLKIKRIVYIDPYPDIAETHTFGNHGDVIRPKLEMFSGAIGQAYFKLFAPFLPVKDELSLLLAEKIN